MCTFFPACLLENFLGTICHVHTREESSFYPWRRTWSSFKEIAFIPLLVVSLPGYGKSLQCSGHKTIAMIFLGQRSVKFKMTFFRTHKKFLTFLCLEKSQLQQFLFFWRVMSGLKSQSRTNGTCQASSSTMMPDQKAMDTGNCLCFDHYNFPTLLRCVFSMLSPNSISPPWKESAGNLGDNFLRLKNCLHPKLPFLPCFITAVYCPVSRSIQYHTIASKRLLLSRGKCYYRITALAICKMQTCSIIQSFMSASNYLTSFSL